MLSQSIDSGKWTGKTINEKNYKIVWEIQNYIPYYDIYIYMSVTCMYLIDLLVCDWSRKQIKKSSSVSKAIEAIRTILSVGSHPFFPAGGRSFEFEILGGSLPKYSPGDLPGLAPMNHAQSRHTHKHVSTYKCVHMHLRQKLSCVHLPCAYPQSALRCSIHMELSPPKGGINPPFILGPINKC